MNENDFRLKLLRELEHLNRTLDKLLNAANRPRNNNDPCVDAQYAGEESSHSDNTCSTVAHLRQGQDSHARPQYKWYQPAYWQSRPLEWWKHRVEIIAFGFAIGYAIVTYFQWRDANRNFREDETPYIWVRLGEPVFVDGQPAMIPLDISNVGKTPAMAVRFCTFTMYGVNISTQLHKMSLESCGKEGLNIRNGGRVVPPNASGARQDIEFVNSTYHDSDKPLLDSQDDYLAVQGVVQYEDMFNRTWEEGWCFHRLKRGNMADCAEFSYISEVHLGH